MIMEYRDIYIYRWLCAYSMHQTAGDIWVVCFPEEHTACSWLRMCTVEKLLDHWGNLRLWRSKSLGIFKDLNQVCVLRRPLRQYRNIS